MINAPYLEYEIAVRPAQMKPGENVLEMTSIKLRPDLNAKVHLLELELTVEYA